MSRFQRITAWEMFALALMVLSGWLLADLFTPPAAGIPIRTLALQEAQTPLDREIVPLMARHGGRTIRRAHIVGATGRAQPGPPTGTGCSTAPSRE